VVCITKSPPGGSPSFGDGLNISVVEYVRSDIVSFIVLFEYSYIEHSMSFTGNYYFSN
jgi:hypothetical protein